MSAGLEPGGYAGRLRLFQPYERLTSEITGSELLAEIEAAGLTGRGGAAFPTHIKMRGVLAGPAPRVVVANAAEGEPASDKDKTLLATNPHLVLDGLQLAAQVLDADRAFLYVHDAPEVISVAIRALAEHHAGRPDGRRIELVGAPPAFVAGEESSVVSRISGGPAVPRSKPPRVFESGAFGRPTLVQNVETLAHIAYIARAGAAEFRRLGPPSQPGTMLFTVTGAVHSPGVVEAPVGTPLVELIQLAGGLSAHPQAVLLGGYHGAWTPWDNARGLTMSNDALRPYGLTVGAGVIVVLPTDACGPAEVARVLDYLAASSAGQCGPCVFGLPALAASYRDVAMGRRGARHQQRLADLPVLLERRGGCNHPDGSLRFLRTAQVTFADHLATHRRGKCPLRPHAPVLPIPVTGR
ncbi:MAG TPA: SLBB domain-containing protein [Mycobacteriales bacterium]|jgi:NADH:ubiquinone oxidoreductase subunit F (NADH-binding)|nr:SLBB domain-containing protein [Mycobacteriales bacterium]